MITKLLNVAGLSIGKPLAIRLLILTATIVVLAVLLPFVLGTIVCASALYFSNNLIDKQFQKGRVDQ